MGRTLWKGDIADQMWLSRVRGQGWLSVIPSELSVSEMTLSQVSQLAFRKWTGQSEPRGFLGNSIPDSGN